MAVTKPKSPFTGRWRIVSMSAWEQDYIDEEEDGYFDLNEKGGGEFHFGCVHGQMDCRPTIRDGEPAVEWTWDGNDEMDAAQGRGWVVVKGDELHGKIFFQGGDDSEFVARKPSILQLETPDRPPLHPIGLGIAQRRAIAEILPDFTERLKLDQPKQRTSTSRSPS